jgi:hypothetical protein
MVTSLLVAYQYPYNLIFGPAFVMFLVVGIALLLKYPAWKQKISLLLIAFGVIEVPLALAVAFIFGFVMGLATVFLGLIIGAVDFRFWAARHLSPQKVRAVRKALFAFLAIVLVISGTLFSLRATNVLHEPNLFSENYHGGNNPNLIVNGTVEEIKLNYQVNLGYNYHVFPA